MASLLHAGRKKKGRFVEKINEQQGDPLDSAELETIPGRKRLPKTNSDFIWGHV